VGLEPTTHGLKDIQAPVAPRPAGAGSWPDLQVQHQRRPREIASVLLVLCLCLAPVQRTYFYKGVRRDWTA
jgi:hypothetical protein